MLPLLLFEYCSGNVCALCAVASPLLAIAPTGVLAPMFCIASIGFSPADFRSATALWYAVLLISVWYCLAFSASALLYIACANHKSCCNWFASSARSMSCALASLPYTLLNASDHELPMLSSEWIDEPKENVDRTIAVTSQLSHQFIADFVFQAYYPRPMPVYSVPGLIDHV